ncbi:MFS transporter [Herbaspirillum sp. YR522]|uniref:MFS transporter n=1 Tax=Herbaspirillum sp. YR522 TaxID=1144342 RepID=UPI00026F761B|nr:MFS transporter [Herbaspirillum sp. YR522]EJN10000.1 arabinose efflux permease family protein [Herbaspirillum sp. YR522]
MSTSTDTPPMSSPGARPLLPLVGIIFCEFLSIGIPLPALPLHVNGGLGYSALVVGWVVGIQSFSTILSRQFSGSYCDRHGPRRAVCVGLPLAAAAGLLYLASTWIADPGASLAVLILGRLLMGPAESLYLTGAMTWGIGRLGVAGTGRVMAWQGMAMFAALGLGGLVGVGLQERFGFAGVAGVTIALPLLGWAVAAALEPLAVVRGHGDGLPFAAVLRLIGRFGMAAALSTMPFAILTSFLVLLYRHHDWSGAGQAIFGFSAGFIAVRLLFAHLPERLGAHRVAVASVAIELCGQLLLWSAPHPTLALVGTVVTGIGFSLVFPSMGLQAMARVPAHSRGLAIAGFMACVDVAAGLTGPVVGMVIGWAGYPSAFFSGALACVAALMVMTRPRRG